ncbi:HAAS signaling domain-containing protein [Streptomyces sp. AF1A]|jgi:hypothetical protein|uniref:HAAS signaling domain-containing protein n=1 Tax=Streptomyces sp. AF1A TaxID=3394350 RepID=UPI0039BC4F04
MKTVEHPLAVAYLEAVAREAAALAPKHREELLADLREHIEVALAEQPDHNASEVEAVLERLGDPRTIVASAGEGESTAPPVSKWHSLAPLVLLPAAGLLGDVNLVLGALALIAGAVLLWAAPHWRSRDKAIGTAAALPVPVALVGTAFTASSTGLLDPGLLALIAPSVLIPAAASAYLFRAGRDTSS